MNALLHKEPGSLVRLLAAAAGLVLASITGAAQAHILLDAAPGGRLTMNLAMQALIGNEPVSNAMAKWNQVGIGAGQDHEFFIAQTAGTVGSCGRNQINEISSSSTNCGLAFGDSTLAVTTTWSSSGKVIEVDILFNNNKAWSSYSGPLMYNGSGMMVLDINRIALHELGHAAGLNHPDQAGQSVESIMNSHVGDIDTLQPDDIAGAHAIAWDASAATNAPVCSLTASPGTIDAGGNSTLVVSCAPAATSYVWANTGFGNTTSGGVVSPSSSTTYSVTGFNAAGAGNTASVTVFLAAPPANPDFEVTSVTGPGSGSAGGKVNLTAQVRNNGGATASSIRVGFYLSTGATLNASDLIGTCSFLNGLLAGQTHLCSGSATIPANLAAGNYILRAVVDDIQSINESNETNNIKTATPDVFVVVASQPPVCQLQASPSIIGPGGSTTLIASCSPAATSYAWSNTGFGPDTASGAVSPVATTSYSVTGVNAAGAGSPAVTTVSIAATAAVNNYADLWWGGNAENGWGLSINQHGNHMFATLYVYDAAGKPVWYVMPTGNWDGAMTTFSGMLYQPTSAPLNNYDPSRFSAGSAVGSISISFTGASTAVLQYTINGVAGQKSIERMAFGSGAAPLNVGDMWWGGSSQDGWGVSIAQQAGTLFTAWYTYGPDGRVTWYVMPTGNWSGTTYSGAFYSTTSSAWLGTAYNGNQLAVTRAGNMSLSFNGDSSAVMTYTFTSGPFAGITQSRSITRMTF